MDKEIFGPLPAAGDETADLIRRLQKIRRRWSDELRHRDAAIIDGVISEALKSATPAEVARLKEEPE
jgi:uncharacterized membrane protein